MKLWISCRIIALLFVRPPCRIHLFNIRTFPSGKLESLAGSWVYTNLRASSVTLTYIDPDWFFLLSEFGSRFSTVNKLCIHDKKTQKPCLILKYIYFYLLCCCCYRLVFPDFNSENGSFTESVSVWIVFNWRSYSAIYFVPINYSLSSYDFYALATQKVQCAGDDVNISDQRER